MQGRTQAKGVTCKESRNILQFLLSIEVSLGKSITPDSEQNRFHKKVQMQLLCQVNVSLTGQEIRGRLLNPLDILNSSTGKEWDLNGYITE